MRIALTLVTLALGTLVAPSALAQPLDLVVYDGTSRSKVIAGCSDLASPSCSTEPTLVATHRKNHATITGGPAGATCFLYVDGKVESTRACSGTPHLWNTSGEPNKAFRTLEGRSVAPNGTLRCSGPVTVYLDR